MDENKNEVNEWIVNKSSFRIDGRIHVRSVARGRISNKKSVSKSPIAIDTMEQITIRVSNKNPLWRNHLFVSIVQHFFQSTIPNNRSRPTTKKCRQFKRPEVSWSKKCINIMKLTILRMIDAYRKQRLSYNLCSCTMYLCVDVGMR